MFSFSRFFTHLRIGWYLLNNHPDKEFRRSVDIESTPTYAIYDADNNQRLTVRLSMGAWRELSNRKINQMLQTYGT